MDREKFEQLVSITIQALPDEFSHRLENIAIVVQDRSSVDQIHRVGLRHSQSILGLYEGVPLTKRGYRYGLVPPDKITIFQKLIERKRCQSNTKEEYNN